MDQPLPDITRLLEILAREQALLSSLEDLIGGEREAIRSLSKDEFRHIDARRQQILHELALEEQERAHVVLRLASAWGIHPDDVTVQDLMSRAGPTLAPMLEQYRISLSAAVAKVREGLGTNRALISRFLGVVRDGLTGWKHAANVPIGYSPSGSPNPMITGGTLFEQKG